MAREEVRIGRWDLQIRPGLERPATRNERLVGRSVRDRMIDGFFGLRCFPLCCDVVALIAQDLKCEWSVTDLTSLLDEFL